MAKIQDQVQKARQAEAERQRVERNLAAWAAILSEFKSDHELRVERYRDRGVSASHAQELAHADEEEESFFDSLMHGDLAYQPPPMPPDR
ncbi:MAG TPA: hypothetical protein VKY89_06615 [Thermoanaerobaculia bacterium]|jgi:hypothetical protein|nr:hypothetical protein [Thermoanaerobaculia bacterium]